MPTYLSYYLDEYVYHHVYKFVFDSVICQLLDRMITRKKAIDEWFSQTTDFNLENYIDYDEEDDIKYSIAERENNIHYSVIQKHNFTLCPGKYENSEKYDTVMRQLSYLSIAYDEEDCENMPINVTLYSIIYHKNL